MSGLRTTNVHVQVGDGVDRATHPFVQQPPSSYEAQNVEPRGTGALTKITGSEPSTLSGVGLSGSIMGVRKGRDAEEVLALGIAGGRVYADGEPRQIQFGSQLPCEVIVRDAISPAGSILSANIAHVGGWTAVVASVFRDSTKVSGANAKALEAVLVILDADWRVVWGPHYTTRIGILPRVEPVTVSTVPGFIFLGLEDTAASPAPADAGFASGSRELSAAYVAATATAAPSFTALDTVTVPAAGANKRLIPYDTYGPGEQESIIIAYYDAGSTNLLYGTLSHSLSLNTYAVPTSDASKGDSMAVWWDPARDTVLCYSREMGNVYSSPTDLSATVTTAVATKPDIPCFFMALGLLRLNDRTLFFSNHSSITVSLPDGYERPVFRRPQDLGNERGGLFMRGNTFTTTLIGKARGGAELQTLDEFLPSGGSQYYLHPVAPLGWTRQPEWYEDTFHLQPDGTGWLGEVGQSAKMADGSMLFPHVVIDYVSKAEINPSLIKWQVVDLAIAGLSSFGDSQLRVVVEQVRFASPTYSIVDHFGSALVAAGRLVAFDGVCTFEPCPELPRGVTGSGSPYQVSSALSPLIIGPPGSGTARMSYVTILTYKDKSGVRYRGPENEERGQSFISATAGGLSTSFPDRLEVGLLPSHLPQHYAGLGWELEVYVSDPYDSVSGAPSNYKWAGTFPVNKDADGFFADTTNISGGMNGAFLDPQTAPYTDSDLPNTRPPALQVLARAGAYLFGIGYEDPYEIWCSKPLANGLGPEFHPSLTIRAPAESGGVVSLAGTDDRLLLLCRNGAWELYTNQGPDAAGVGAFGAFRTLWKGDGCVDHRWTVTCDAGVMYCAESGPKWLPTGSPQVVDMARRVDEFYSTAEIGCSVYHPIERRIYLYHSSERAALVYDVTADAWTTTTLRADAAAVYRSKLLRLLNGQLRVGDASSVQDRGTPYSARVVSPWLRFDDSLSFKRCRRISTLLQYLKGTYGVIRISLEYDYIDGVVDTFEWTAAQIAALARLGQLTVRPSRQKFSSVRITVEDVTQSVPAGQEVQQLNDLQWALVGHTFEVLSKQGTVKLESGAQK